MNSGRREGPGDAYTLVVSPETEAHAVPVDARDEGFYTLFKQAADNAVACSAVLRDLAAPPEDASLLVGKLIEAEHRGNEIVKAMQARLDTAIVTPFDREDILALISGLDSAVDDLRNAGEFIDLHRIAEPLPEATEISDVVHQMAETTVRLMVKLPKLRDLREELDEIDQLGVPRRRPVSPRDRPPVLGRVQGVHGPPVERRGRVDGEHAQLL